MCCLNRQNKYYFCHCTPCFVPYFWQGGLVAVGYNQANATALANQTNSFNQANFLAQHNCNWGLTNTLEQTGNYANPVNGLVPTNGFGNIMQCCRPRYTFANCCRGHRVFANNFAIDRPVSASFVHTPNYSNIVELGF